KHYYNYFLGKDPSKWKAEIHPALNVDYKNIYPGIDVHVASEKGQLKYDFIVAPGADAEVIKLRFEGAEGIDVRKGNLEIATSVGAVSELQPYAYQYIDGEKKEVSCKYRLKGNTVRYVFPKDYDHSQTLI